MMFTQFAIEMPDVPSLLVVGGVIVVVATFMFVIHRAITLGEKKDLERLEAQGSESKLKREYTSPAP